MGTDYRCYVTNTHWPATNMLRDKSKQYTDGSTGRKNFKWIEKFASVFNNRKNIGIYNKSVGKWLVALLLPGSNWYNIPVTD